jgi:Putative transposase/Transposase zinc-binding domain
MRAIEVCRTAALGGHKDQCDHCGHVEISYNSCRNRHCPKCQTLRKEKWIEARSEDLLPIQYFHVVFTIPSELNPLVSMNRKVIYDLLFRSVSETLTELAHDPKYLGAGIGGISILHTWGQNLMDHPHLHCIVTGGGLSSDKGRWVSCRKGFFIPVRVLSALFKGKFLDLLKRCFESDDLVFPDRIRHLKPTEDFERFRSQLYYKNWVVYCKPPFDGVKGVLQYLGRYTHRIAINNHRILNMHNGDVSFLWRDYADHNRQKTMTLKADEFIRRFLLHVLPPRYVRIRHFGLLANRKRKKTITLCRQILEDAQTLTQQNGRKETWQEQLFRICGLDVTLCPVCQKGRMYRVALLLPYRCNSP